MIDSYDYRHQILSETMSAPLAFESRRQELKILHGNSITITDEEVVDSFLDLVDPALAPERSLLLSYLYQGQIAKVIGDTVFVHGGINDLNFG